MVCYSHLFKSFPQFAVIHTLKGFSIVSEEEPAVGDLISGSLDFSKSSFTSGSSWFTYCWSLAWRILSIVSVEWCMRQVLRAGALGRPSGMGWGGRWEGEIRMVNTCKSMADSCQCMQKPLQYCKVVSLQLIKINGRKYSLFWRMYFRWLYILFFIVIGWNVLQISVSYGFSFDTVVLILCSITCYLLPIYSNITEREVLNSLIFIFEVSFIPSILFLLHVYEALSWYTYMY